MRPCLACGQLIATGSYCRAHQPGRRGSRWERNRRRALRRDHYRCVICGAPAVEVHHVETRTDGRQDHPDNLEAVCFQHNPR